MAAAALALCQLLGIRRIVDDQLLTFELIQIAVAGVRLSDGLDATTLNSTKHLTLFLFLIHVPTIGLTANTACLTAPSLTSLIPTKPKRTALREANGSLL